MPTETKISQPAPRYEATVTHDGTDVVATLGAAGSRDEVLLQAGKGRSILHVPLSDWPAFAALIAEVDEAVKTKATTENPATDQHLQVPVTPAAAEPAEPIEQTPRTLSA